MANAKIKSTPKTPYSDPFVRRWANPPVGVIVNLSEKGVSGCIVVTLSAMFKTRYSGRTDFLLHPSIVNFGYEKGLRF